MNCSKIIKNNKKNIVAEEDKKPFKVFYYAQIFEKVSVKCTDSFYFKDCDTVGDKLFQVAILKFSKV